MRLIGTALTAVGMAFAAAAWACPDTKTSGTRDPLPADEAAETTLLGPTPELALEAPVLSGIAGAARFRDGDTRVLESPLNWLLQNSGPKGGVRLSAERVSRSPAGKPGAVAEATKTSKDSVVKRGSSKGRGGSGGHIAKPHRMPSLEIL